MPLNKHINDPPLWVLALFLLVLLLIGLLR